MIDGFFMALGENLLTAAIGGVVTLASGVAVRKFRRYKLESKYPIAGNYISEYEDVVDGEKIVVKAPVQLIQTGLRINGSTKFDGRTWILNGEISEHGHLFGMYHAESIHDKGIGNFFLEMQINGDMEGLWSGYDSVNRVITSGRYSFHRQPKFVIEKIEKMHIPAVLSIAEKQLGEAYINVGDLLSNGNIASYAAVSGKIVGFCTGKKVTLQKIYDSIPQLKEMKLKQLEAVENLGMVASVATDPSYSGKGIGTELVVHCIKELKRMGLNVLVMTGWKSEKGIHIGSIAKNHGFVPILEVQDFWKEDSIKSGYSCPSCGKPPCRCSAVVYIKHTN